MRTPGRTRAPSCARSRALRRGPEPTPLFGEPRANTLTSQAHAFDLNGAWATGTDQCKQVFVKKGDKIDFAQFSEEFGGGFIADGNDVRSKTTRCTITSRKEAGDTIDFQAVCASEIMATSTNLRLKILDANSVFRTFTDPSMAGMELTFLPLLDVIASHS
jgi:hypothetical protein